MRQLDLFVIDNTQNGYWCVFEKGGKCYGEIQGEENIGGSQRYKVYCACKSVDWIAEKHIQSYHLTEESAREEYWKGEGYNS